jgi:type I restriction enzyme S subunit
MFAAYPGDLIFSKIDARNGAIGLVPNNLPKVVVTSEYPIHSTDPKQVDGRYMAMLLRTPNFLKLIRNAASGTSGRKRITPENFRSIEIPLPELKDQRRLVAAYQKGLDKASELEDQALQIERDAQRKFEGTLGLTPPPNLPKRPFQIARFKDIERWSHEGILQRSVMPPEGSTEGFPIVTLREVVNNIENGWSVQCASRMAKDDEWAILKISAVSTGTYDPKQNKALPPKLKPRPELEVRPGDLIISRCNIARLVGVSAIVRTTPPRLMLCDKLFRVLFRQGSPVHPEFLNAVLKTPSVRQQIEAKVTGTSPTMKNISKQSLLELTFPLPTLQIQERQAEEWQKRFEESGRLKKKAGALRAAAWNDFITAVFSQ